MRAYHRHVDTRESGDQVDGDRRGQLLSAARPALPRHLAVLAACLLLLTLTVSGCASILGALQTGADLQSAGFQNVAVNVSTGSDPSGELVDVIYSRGPTGDDGQDAQRAEKIVWDTLPGRFAAVTIIKESGGCAGPVCSSVSSPVATATHAQLVNRYGPRPHGLDRASATGHVALAGWVAILVIGLAAAVLAAAAIVLVIIFRHRRRRPPPGPAPPVPGWPPGPQPWTNYPT
jgi:hypothetical protein